MNIGPLDDVRCAMCGKVIPFRFYPIRRCCGRCRDAASAEVSWEKFKRLIHKLAYFSEGE